MGKRNGNGKSNRPTRYNLGHLIDDVVDPNVPIPGKDAQETAQMLLETTSTGTHIRGRDSLGRLLIDGSPVEREAGDEDNAVAEENNGHALSAPRSSRSKSWQDRKNELAFGASMAVAGVDPDSNGLSLREKANGLPLQKHTTDETADPGKPVRMEKPKWARRGGGGSRNKAREQIAAERDHRVAARITAEKGDGGPAL